MNNLGAPVVLAVEDNEGIRLLLKTQLEKQGLKAITVANGMEALEQLVLKQNIDLMLVDLMMPMMDGFALLKRIRNSKDEFALHHPNLKICVVSSLGDKKNVSKAIMEGADDYLVKPIDFQVLHDKINSLLNISQDRKSSFFELDVNYDASVEGLPIDIKITITKLSETEIVFQSPVKFKDEANLQIKCGRINGEENIQYVISNTSQASMTYFHRATIFAPDEKLLKNIRKLTINKNV